MFKLSIGPVPIDPEKQDGKHTKQIKKDKKKKKKKHRHEKVITKSMYFACQKISNLESLLIYLTSKEVLTTDECEHVTSKPTTLSKCRYMLNLFERKNETAFEILKTGLLETANSDVADEFDRIGQQMDEQEDEEDTDGQQPGTPNKTKEKVTGKRKPKSNEDQGEENEDSVSSDSSDEEVETVDDEVHQLVDLFYDIKKRVKHMHYYPDEEFFVHRFKTIELSTQNSGSNGNRRLIQDNDQEVQEIKPISVNTRFRYNLPFWTKTQHFRVNRPIYLSKVGFFGPSKANVTSYRIKVQLIKTEPTDAKFLQIGVLDEIGIIGESFQAVEVQKGEIVYIPFKFPIGVEPNSWYKIKFKISGMDKILVNPRDLKLPEVIVDCKRHGNVKFEFGTRFFNSTCQIPVLGFFKGKSRLTVSSFPSTCKDLVKFEDQQEVIDWQDKDKLITENGSYLIPDD